ncbi:hypothetical protein FCL47_12325 [Desulfopila sp. IMCC35006]|uniref:hypothetical protein n=1 Tax=Desulfopila sp. IMCC35006 TaxID=2569542 RepID=UPI0010ABF4BE|nr:hypothetical protein [Desulfopila sp. IMCC35006]TKB25875.1 hypothetical protein FCL47_12325 [Desulfopila sp. IMCC35006]
MSENTPVEPVEKTPLERSRDILSQIKEMQHYSISNIEKLTGFYLEIEDELKQKKIAEKIEDLLDKQHSFNDSVGELISSYENELNRLEEES